MFDSIIATKLFGQKNDNIILKFFDTTKATPEENNYTIQSL